MDKYSPSKQNSDFPSRQLAAPQVSNQEMEDMIEEISLRAARFIDLLVGIVPEMRDEEEIANG